MARKSGYLHVHEHKHSGTQGNQPWMVKIKISDASELDDLLDADGIENLERDH